MSLELSAPQNIFLNTLNTKYRAYVGGFGSGKTFVGCLDLLLFALNYPKAIQGYFAPSYGAIRDIFFPTIAEAAELLGFTVKINMSNKEVHLFRGGFSYGTIICRSMDNPQTIVGFKVARALVDEIDILTKPKAEQAWRKIIARLRLTIPNVVNGIGVTTTPEGFLFVHDRFASRPTESYSMVQASSYENQKYLPEDYIPSLLESYPSKVAQAYINGDFVNMRSGTVYNNYDRKLNHTDRTVKPDDILYIGMDFNVGQMAGIVHVKDELGLIAVDEIVDAYDTPEIIQMIKARYPNQRIRVYPDAAGGSRKSVDASKNDIALLSQSGFTVIADNSNPRVKDRVLAMNVLFCNNNGIRRYRVNALKCPTVADNLEQQVWNDAGEPDKTQGKDHTNDACGYLVYQDYPIEKPLRDLKIQFAR
tara:strand:- start:12047 stop:13306 length:1260 start_codon:yes stop_codon:yes gene_type:complete